MATAQGQVDIGTVRVVCPECGEQMPATVSAEIVPESVSASGRFELACVPDMTDIWAHMWTHGVSEQ